MPELRSLHADLLDAMAQLDAVAANAQCEAAAFTAARYRVARISSERRRVVEALCLSQARTAPPDRSAALHGLRQANMEGRVRATAHIAQWTVAEAVAHWNGYRMAWSRLRLIMRAQIRHEELLLYAAEQQAA